MSPATAARPTPTPATTSGPAPPPEPLEPTAESVVVGAGTDVVVVLGAAVVATGADVVVVDDVVVVVGSGAATPRNGPEISNVTPPRAESIGTIGLISAILRGDGPRWLEK